MLMEEQLYYESFQKQLSKFINAFENSSKIKSAKYLYESKNKLVGNAYSKKDWSSNFTSTYTNNNKLYDHDGSYLNEETNLKIFDWKIKWKNIVYEN